MSRNPLLIALLLILTVALMHPPETKGKQNIELLPSVPEVIAAEPEEPVVEIPPYVRKGREEYYLMIYKEFKNEPVMLRIAFAESGFNPLAKNPNSTASGLFQILKGTWAAHKCEGEVFDAEDNIACARKIYDRNGTRDWLASKNGWE